MPPCTPEPLASVNVVCPQQALPTTTSSIDPTHRTREVDILRNSITTSTRLIVLFSHFKIQIVNRSIHGACSKFWLVIQKILHPVPMFGKNRFLRASQPCISREVGVLTSLSAQERRPLVISFCTAILGAHWTYRISMKMRQFPGSDLAIEVLPHSPGATRKIGMRGLGTMVNLGL